ncbi:hypothetical protein MHM84_03815 [Halomonas sp. McH1-25]|uniref:hypothetical protein n=1 Tax=unclassified Halomonas TaxID=2609666 RepID=UPI001EF69388|nr:MULTISPECIES: hypothetical protein [unclassified Halomonas]MCG7598900.1 hypothetical protein [Halomonas sp. McH1-25]MCP1340863.1 hypothetical protein [Halomonas sp. FL8]MCP1361254.1 hypothetical protein [Halomonas sp. BBD45]MCP1366366.1 hypothetical protein [Halomonas sp. BBD48]
MIEALLMGGAMGQILAVHSGSIEMPGDGTTTIATPGIILEDPDSAFVIFNLSTTNSNLRTSRIPRLQSISQSGAEFSRIDGDDRYLINYQIIQFAKSVTITRHAGISIPSNSFSTDIPSSEGYDSLKTMIFASLNSTQYSSNVGTAFLPNISNNGVSFSVNRLADSGSSDYFVQIAEF